MKLSNKISIWLYGLAMIAGLFNAYFAYKGGNGDAAFEWVVAAGLSGGAAAFAWVVAAGLAGGALGAHLEIKELKDGEE